MQERLFNCSLELALEPFRVAYKVTLDSMEDEPLNAQ